MWGWVKNTLDRRWKRIAFLFWLPLFALTLGVTAYALVHLYYVHFAFDGWVRGCHIRALGVTGSLVDADLGLIVIANRRADSRLSLDTLEAERNPTFLGCIFDRSPNGKYWLNYPFIWQEAGRLALWTTLFALVIFPRFWRAIGRAIGNWITMKT
jgi:hypothetical protein